MMSDMPPEYLKNVLDGSSEASFIVLSDGVIFHANESSRRKFNITNDESQSLVSEYISFHTLSGAGEETRQLKWADVVHPDSFTKHMRQVDGIGIKTNKERFPATISVVRMNTELNYLDESVNEVNGNPVCFYCLYVQDLSPARLQIASMEEQLDRLSATKDAIIRASGQSMVVVDGDKRILSVSGGISETLGYEVGNDIVGLHIDALIREKVGSLELQNDNLREAQGIRKDGSTIEVKVGLSEATRSNGTKGDTIVMVNDTSQWNERVREKSMNDRISRGMKERSYILDQAEILAKKNLTSKIIDASYDALFVINQRGIIHMVNATSTKVFGWTREEFLGNNINMIMPPEHAKKHDGYLERFMRTGERRMMGTEREVEAVRKDNTRFPCILGLSEVSSNPGEDTIFCGFIRSLAQKKDMERQLTDQTLSQVKTARELLNQKNTILGILDASFHALFVMNEECIIQLVNQVAVNVFGWSKDEFVGSNINIIMTKDDAAHHDQYVHDYLKTGVKKMIGTSREVIAQRKDGSTFPCVLGLAEPQSTGLICGFIRDLTSEKAARAEILEKQKLMEKIVEASFDALFVISQRGIIQMVNGASSRVFGWTHEEFLGKNISMIMPEHHASKHDSYLIHYILTGFKKVSLSCCLLNHIRCVKQSILTSPSGR